MQYTESENSSSDEQVNTIVKNPVGRPRTAEWRREGDKYNDRPISKTYFKDYYQEKLGVKVICEFCGKSTNKQKLKSQHQLSKKCLNFQNLDFDKNKNI